MLRSINEVTSELRKACLGAGYPIGHAEDLSKAAASLIAHGYDGAAALLQGLETDYVETPFTIDQNAAVSIGPKFRAAKDGCALLEYLLARSDISEVLLENLDAPILMIGIGIQFSKTYDCRLQISAGDQSEFQITPKGISGQLPNSFTRSESSMKIAFGDSLPNVVPNEVATPSIDALSVNEELWPKIKALAAKTYVPSSEASRVKGAGASINDND